MPFVVDNSVVAGWFLASQADDYTDGVLALLRADVAIVPPLWEYELANVARTAIARGVLSEKDARLAFPTCWACRSASTGRPSLRIACWPSLSSTG